MTAQSSDKTVGIIGGMGPQATVDLMQRIIQLTPAADDMDHIRCIVDNNPKIPSRIKALIDGEGEDPAPCLVEMAKGLVIAGADFLAIPCNTAHHYYDIINQAVNIPVIHIIDAVLATIQQNYPDCNKVAILASPAIQITKLYEQKLSPAGLDIIYPDPDDQEQLFKVIKEVKKGETGKANQQLYTEVCNNLTDKGVELAIVACTELSILDTNSSLKTLDAAEILAKKIVQLAKSDLE